MSRRAIRRWCQWAAIVAGGVAAILALSGGVDLSRRITIHNPRRPLAVAVLALAGYVLAGGRFRSVTSAARSVRPAVTSGLRRVRDQGTRAARLFPRIRIRHDVVAGVLVLVSLAGALRYGARAVGGADSYGYLSEAYLWLAGTPRQAQAFVSAVPIRAPRWVFSPLGYRPAGDTTDLVPTYAPGLPLLMAGAIGIGGFRAAFLVVPVASALAVLATYVLGRRIGSPWAGVAGAWLLATSPTFLMQSLVSPMSDVPVTAAWALAFVCLSGARSWSAAAAGAMTGLAVLIRLNLAPLAAVPALWIVVEAVRRRGRRDRTWWMRPAAFAAGITPLLIVAALVNQALYGSPFITGYGDVGLLFSWRNLLPNFRQYAAWLTETQGFAIWLGVAVLLVPLRVVWARAPRADLAAWAAFCVLLWVEYSLYSAWDAWWYLRFLLPAYPFILIGLGQIAVTAARRRRVLGIAGVVLIALLGWRGLAMAVDRGVFTSRWGASKYVTAARVVRDATEPSSVVLSMLHSGSLRFYAGRMTANFDSVETGDLDLLVAWLADRGIHAYALLEDAEVDSWRGHFDADSRLRRLDWPPLREIRGAVRMRLFDLTSRDAAPTMVVSFEPDDLDSARPIPIRGFHLQKR